jgi:ELWxxDGT repeat protein
MKALYAYSISILVFYSTGLHAQEASLVKDINTTISTSSNPSSYLQVGSTTFFTATLPETGTELWKTDGTPEGTILIKDIFPGPESGGPFSLVNVNGTLYFSARDANHGGELWKSDGTEAGTVLVKDILPGTLTGLQPSLTNVNGTLFFWANDGIHGSELWKTDGTDAGTVMIKDMIPGPGAGAVPFTPSSRIVASGSLLFFAFNDGIHGLELWRSDGTEVGTFMVKDILDSQPNTGDVGVLTNVDGTLYFRGMSSTGYDLWKSDGTETGTVLVKDLAPGVFGGFITENMTHANGLIYFIFNEPATSSELWVSDGTEGGTNLVKDIVPGPSTGFFSNINQMIGYNDRVFFRVNDGINGWELWTSDGTEAGTYLVKDINPGTSSADPQNFALFNGMLYFSANGGQGMELWRSDGTAEGTNLVKNIASGTTSSSPSSLTPGVDALFFRAFTNESGAELWKSDGTETGTILVKDLVTTSFNTSSGPINIATINDQVYFLASNGTRAMLWKSDGTSDGTTIIKDPSPSFFSVSTSNPSFRHHTVIGNMYYFINQNQHLWQSDGTEAGTTPSTITAQVPSFIDNLTPSGNIIFFKGSTSLQGAELWVYDATGVHRVKDINPGISSGLPTLSEMVDMNGTLFFTADDGMGGAGLWKSDGTEFGTTLVKAIPNLFFGVSPLLTNINGTLFFTANDGINGHELWKSDGTESGTFMVKDVNPGSASSNISTQAITTTIINVNGVAYFKADGGTGVELWKSDGTEQGTVKVKEIASGNASSFPANLVNANGTLFFTAFENAHGTELWKTDGTDAGTVLVKDITPGPAASHIQLTTAVGNKIYFYLTGSGIWESDGTEVGTKLIAGDISVRSSFVKAGDALYFLGHTFNTQLELWKLSLQKLTQTITFNPIEPKISGGPAFDLSATASSTLPVTFSSASDKITITGKTVSLLKAGKAVVSADQEGSTNYQSAPTVSQEFCINPAKPVLTETITSVSLVTLSSNSTTGTHQWFKDGNIIAGESGTSIDVTQSGAYKVKVIVDDCVSEFSEVETILITGIEGQENEITLHPNPTSQFVVIKLPEANNNKTITLVSPQGKEIQYHITGENSVNMDVASVPSGIYLVKIQYGKFLITRKLVRK